MGFGSNNKFAFALITIFLALAILGIVVHIARAGPATWTNYDTYCISSTDCFRNWDSNDPNNFLPSTADWPVTLIYIDNAEVDKIKQNYAWPLTGFGNSMYMYMTDDGVNWFVDSDRGMKTIGDFHGITLCGKSLGYEYVHVRLYAMPGRDYNIEPTLGHYVVATSHLDSFPSESWSGFPDLARSKALDRASQLGWSVVNALYLYNADPTCRVVGDHINLHDGYAVLVDVP